MQARGRGRQVVKDAQLEKSSSTGRFNHQTIPKLACNTFLILFACLSYSCALYPLNDKMLVLSATSFGFLYWSFFFFISDSNIQATFLQYIHSKNSYLLLFSFSFFGLQDLVIYLTPWLFFTELFHFNCCFTLPASHVLLITPMDL